ncbi:hypothetical protein QEG73_05500 [Chitinophagaceae bacterium 26-R-25]|nr:hypothetical protein [Chitinophagaceae bacterium 26-R-25]
MKKKLTLLSIATLLTICSFAQSIRLNGYAIGAFDDGVDSYYSTTNYYNGTIKGGLVWGAGLEFAVHEDNGIELLYMRQDTKAPMNYYQLVAKNTEFKVGMNYAMIGGTRYFRGHNKKVEGYGGLLLGANFMHLENPDNGKSGDKTFFAWGLRLGGNFWASEKVGIKLQAQLLSNVQAAGGGFYFGTGGAGAGISTYSTMYQFGLGGGLTFRLK